MRNITNRHQRFVEQYCTHFNGARAAREAGFSERRANRTAYRLLQDEDIQRLVEERMEELSMSAAETTRRMTEIAEADFADFYTIKEDEEGQKYAALDLVKLIEEGPSHLVKKLKYTRNGPHLEIYDKQKALRDLMKAHGEFEHKKEMEVSGPDGEPIPMQWVDPESIDDQDQ